jgi:hypothetical protein
MPNCGGALRFNGRCISQIPAEIRLSSLRRRIELAHNCEVFVADLLEQSGHRFEIPCVARRLGFSETLSEKSSADSTRARLECMCRALDRFRTSFFHRLLQSREARGSILHERLDQRPDDVLDSSLAKVPAEARQVYVRRFWAL